MRNRNENLQMVEEGAVIFIQGHEFIVKNFRVETWEDGQAVCRFEGICTDNPANDSIRNTGFNGGTYGGNHLAYNFEVPKRRIATYEEICQQKAINESWKRQHEGERK